MADDFHVLIVDDDHALCRSLQEAIGAAGYRVECLTGQGRPQQHIRELAPDLILLEVSGPSMRGLETLRQLQLHRATKKIPVIIISHQVDLEYELVDVFDFLAKPVNEQRLLENITLLAGSRQQGGSDIFAPLTSADLERFQPYLITHSGLHFDRRNSKILERGLLRRMRAVGVRSYAAYYDYLREFGESRRELHKLLGLLTVGETFFFRYQAHFEGLRRSVLPDLLVRNRDRRSLRIWSAGCSTGAEPYSVAMLLLEHFPELATWDLRILASDINHRALREAREGIYNARALRVTDPLYREKYFSPHGKGYRLCEQVRNMVDFSYLNLQTGEYPSAATGTEGVDILMCRNVLIYFREQTMRQIVERFGDCLQPGGYLFLGHAETLINLSDRFDGLQRAGGFFYRLREGAPVPPARVEAPPREPVAPPPVPAVAPEAAGAPGGTVEALRPQAPSVEELFDEAGRAFDSEDFNTASANYDTILGQDPNHLGALVGRGFISANNGDAAAALAFCERALKVDDLSPQAHFLCGLVREMGQQWDQAMVDYGRALLLQIDFVMPHYNLSKLYLRQGRLRDARRELNNTIRLLEQAADEAIIPYSGGLSRAVFMEVCREDAARLEEGKGST